MKICPKCGKVVSYNSYFGAYICTDCNWEDATIGQKRNMGLNGISYRVVGNSKSLKKSERNAFEKKAVAVK